MAAGLVERLWCRVVGHKWSDPRVSARAIAMLQQPTYAGTPHGRNDLALWDPYPWMPQGLMECARCGVIKP